MRRGGLYGQSVELRRTETKSFRRWRLKNEERKEEEKIEETESSRRGRVFPSREIGGSDSSPGKRHKGGREGTELVT